MGKHRDMNDVINMFSVPLYVTQLTGNEKLHRAEVELLKSISMEKQYGDDGNYLSHDAHVIEKYKLNRIRALIDRHVSHYTEHVLGVLNDFKMFKSWLSMNTKGTRHLPHSHRNAMISCVLYFDEHMSDQPLAPISFGQDGLDQVFKTFQFEFKKKEPNQYNNNVLTIYPRTNTLIVFPGWIKHETEEAKSTTKRYCLGTNYFFNGESSGGYHNITINAT
jgi:uncharacterized protein (TIGR02466 family)